MQSVNLGITITLFSLTSTDHSCFSHKRDLMSAAIRTANRFTLASRNNASNNVLTVLLQFTIYWTNKQNQQLSLINLINETNNYSQ